MNLLPKRQHYDTVACSGRKPRGNVQGCVGYQLCYGPRGIVICRSSEVEIIRDAAGVFNAGGHENGGVGGKKGYIYSSSCNFLVQLVRYQYFDSYPSFSWLTNTKRHSLGPAQPPSISWTRSLQATYSTCGEEYF